MISYKLLAIFTVVIVIRSSCGEETECEKSLYEFGIEYNCGYLNFNFVKASDDYRIPSTSELDFLEKFKKFYDIKSLDDDESKKKDGYLQEYITSIYNFSIPTEEREVYNTDSLIPKTFCINKKKKPIHDLLDVKMDERLEELEKKLEKKLEELSAADKPKSRPKHLPKQKVSPNVSQTEIPSSPKIPSSSNKSKKVAVEFSTLNEDVTACNNAFLDYTFDNTKRFSMDNPYRNAIISNEIYMMESDKFKPEEGDVRELYFVYKKKIQEHTNSDKDGIPNVYTQFLLSKFCKSKFPAEYQNENENDNINES